MEKYFANYNQALALKELGFYESCFAFYAIPNNENKLFFDIDPDDGELTSLNQNQIYHNNLSEVGRISAPLKQQVFEWFRENHQIEAVVACFYSKRLGISYEERQYHCHIVRDGITTKGPKFKNYEEAESACIDKLIEIVKSK
jgi:hypothetical protein